ncbi:MAG TPA: HAD family hydrolase [Candidatus Acidoferrales bacterium]|nr:HAD family hydrolase [Candidatus Acidoferrales bacterium]
MSEPYSSAVEVASELQAPLAVGFDFDHTLGIDNKLERTVGVELLERLAMEGGCGFDPDEAGSAMDAALAAFRGGPISLEEALRGEFERVACRGADFDAAIAQFRDIVCQRAPAFVEALPGARELVEALDELGIPHAILTNGWSPLQEEKARLVGFDGTVFVSDVLGAWKPAAAAYDVLVDHFGVSRERVWYVGDDPVADAAGARAAGLTSAWFDWERRLYAPHLVPPHLRIHELGELTALLQGRSSRAPKARL